MFQLQSVVAQWLKYKKQEKLSSGELRGDHLGTDLRVYCLGAGGSRGHLGTRDQGQSQSLGDVPAEFS